MAIYYYNKVLEINKSHENSIYNLANIYFNLQQKRKSLKYFKDYLNVNEENQKNPEVKFVYAYLLSLTGNYSNAKNIYENLYSEISNNYQLVKELISLYFTTSEYDKCKKYLNKLFQINKKFLETGTYKAINLFLNKKYVDAKNEFIKILKIDKNNLIANLGLYKIFYITSNLEQKQLKNVLINLGKIFYNNENYKKSIQFFKKYQKIFPEDFSSHSYLAIVYETIKDYKNAIKELKKAIKLSPNDLKLNFYLAVIYEENKEYKKAIEQLYKVLKIDKTYSYAYLRLSALYEKIGKHDKVIEVLKKAIEINPKNSDYYFLLGSKLIEKNKLNQAIKILTKGIKHNKTNPLIYFQLATAYDKLNNKQKAIENLEICKQLNPNDPEINNFLAYLYSEENIKLNLAEEYIKISLDSDSENYAFLDTAGWIYYRLKDYEKAKYYLEKAKNNMIKNKKPDAIIYKHLIQLYQTLKNDKKVKKYKEDLKNLK